jgi:hypothetical protein
VQDSAIGDDEAALLLSLLRLLLLPGDEETKPTYTHNKEVFSLLFYLERMDLRVARAALAR